jgi:hypothetical protein
MIVWGPVPTALGVSVIWHLETPVVLDGVSAHKSPPPKDVTESEVKLTFPVGLEAVPLLGSLTVAVQVAACPASAGPPEQSTDVEESRSPTARVV